jgi:hypothetical protein
LQVEHLRLTFQQGNEEQKRTACWECDFLKLVRKEEEPKKFGVSNTRLGMDRVFQKLRA